MIVQWLVLVFLIVSVDVCKSAKIASLQTTESPRRNWDFHQTDYDVKPERLVLNKYNNLYIKNPKIGFVLFNRTQRVANGSFDLLRDIQSDGAKLDLQVYKFRSNEYRFFPITITVNPCVEFKHNSFYFRDVLTKTSNIQGCPIKKGFYSIGNAIPDTSKFPPLMPPGQYQVNVKLFYYKDFTAEIDAYGSVIEKPMKWN